MTPAPPSILPRARRRQLAQRRAQLRRRRAGALAVLLVLLVIVGLGLSSITGNSSGNTGSKSPKPTTPAPPPAAPAIEAGVLPWTLTAAVSRPVVLPAGGTSLEVVGGLDSAGNSDSGIFTVDTATGDETNQGKLAAAVHDAAGALVGSQGFLFGGGSPNTVADVESFPAPTPAPAPAATAPTAPAAAPDITGVVTTATAPTATPGTVVGQLPQPRSDAVAVTVGATSYLIGGYDGTNPDPAVLATTDGTHFTVVAQLPVAVRYPAVAAVGTKIYVLGGEAVGGTSAGQPVDDIQVLDTVRKTVTVAGHLTRAVTGASAAVLGGHLYLAGGTTTAGTGTAGAPETAVWAYDPTTNMVAPAGTLPVGTSYAGVTVIGNRAWLIGGENAGKPLSTVEMLVPNPAFGTVGAPGAGSPYFGDKLLVADRGNDRLLLLDDTAQITWTYPSPTAAAPPTGFYFPDDAFFAKKGTEIVSNQEDNQTIVQIAYPSGTVLWSYGHTKVKSPDAGYLNTPDDAYLLRNGQITVADAYNCRILFINPDGTVASQIGTNGVCTHNPPADVGSPNGDTPLADGNVLVSEIKGSWVTEYTPTGTMVWTLHLPIAYPSDPQQLGPDLYLIADYSHPGAILEFNREGQILYTLRPHSGLGELNQPSLVEMLPSGVLLANDDYRNRMVAYDPATGAVVWQYGTPDIQGTGPGLLNTPDGFDLLAPDGSTPTHPNTG